MEPQKLTLNIDQFTINKDANSFCKNYIDGADDRNDERENIFISIEANGFENHNLLEAIASDIKSEFHKNKRSDIKTRFENALRVADAQIKKNKILSSNLSILIASTSDNELLFSKYGQIYACIYKDGQLTNVSPRNRKITNASKTPLKIFPYIIGGKLENDDKLIFFNDPVGNICDQDQLEAFLENDPNKNFSEFQSYLKNYLIKNNRLENPFFILLNPQPKAKKESKAAQQEDDETVQPLSPIQVAVTDPVDIPSKEPLQQPNIIIDKLNGLKENMSIPQISIKIPDIIQTINIPDLSNKAKREASRLLSSISNKKLNKKNKIAISLAILILLFSSVQIYRKVSAKNQFEDLTEEIGRIKNEAAALIANDQTSLAINKLIEAKNLSASISSQLPNFTDKSQQLSADIETELNKTAKITVIDDPEKISDLSNFGIKFIPQKLFKSDNQIIITSSDFGLAYKIDLETKRKGFSFFSTIEDNVIETIKSQNSMAFFTGKNIFIYDPQRKHITDHEFTKKDNQLIAMDNDTIEILDKDAGQISSFSKNNFNPAGKTALNAQIKDISSNGKNLFALSEDNKIIRVSSRQEQITDTNSSLPLLKDPDMIIGDQINGNISVVNKSEKRIATFSEDGEFIKQYDLNSFDEITDIFFDEKNIFILSPSAVFRIDL